MVHPDIPEHDSLIGRRIGSYELVSEIGRGGMGTVYLGRRVDGEFVQTVAVKLIKRGMDTDTILRRFRRERQILASLNHPNIAYFLGGGSTENGLPYFVMEYIDGYPLYKYCNLNQLTIKERLQAFRQICWAVAAAHEIKVIHRDLKPSNILVKPDGKPKLLDFGIAKLLDADLSVTESELTTIQTRAMTPEYASPEQVGGENVGPQSDVYSLGVILYELLTGHRPYSLRRNLPTEVARVIREEVPTMPSGAVTRESDLVPDNGQEMTLDLMLKGRSSTAEELKKLLSGDLDKVVLKALRKDPADRYRTAMDLADDITNYLEGRPVKAEYFVTRASISGHRRANPQSIAILPFKVVGTGDSDATPSEFVGIGMADALIARLSGVSRIVVRPTTSVLPFEHSSPFEAAKQLNVDYVLDGTVRIVGDRIRVSVQLYDAGKDTAAWARAFDKYVGDVLELEDSLAEQVSTFLLPQLSRDERARLARRGTDKPEAYEAYLRGRYFWSRFTDEALLKAVKEFERAVEIDPNYAYPYIGLADYYSWAAIFGEIPSSEGFPKATEAARKALEVNDAMGEAYAALAYCVFLYDWNWSDAEYLLKRAIELSPNYPLAHEYYSNLLVAQGRFDEGLREILKAEELDPLSPRSAMMTSWTLYQCRRFEDSVTKARKAYSMSGDIPQALLHLGNSLTALGDLDEAIEVLRKSAELWRESGLPRFMLAHARAAQGNLDAAEQIYAKMQKTAASKHVKPYFLGLAAVAARDIEGAFRYFEEAVEGRNEWMMWFATEPHLDPLRSDPRYHQLLRRTNNPTAVTATPQSPTPVTGEGPRSIAVLPFKILTTDGVDTGQNDYLSIGLADSVTMRLSNLRKFIVRPTSSVLQASAETDPFLVGEKLGVEFVVDGIIRHVGGGIRVTAQLLDVRENATRWSASFLETISDVLELEDTISEQVTRSLLPRISNVHEALVSKRGTNSREAHEAYLQGRYFWNKLELSAYPKALQMFRKAIELDPDYAQAHAGVADYHTWASIYGIEDPTISSPKVLESAARAIELDPTLGEAHAVLGLYHSNAADWAKSEESYRRAIELNPNYSLAHEWFGALLVGTGRADEGVDEVLVAEGLDPLSLRSRVLSAWTLYQARMFDRALEKARGLEALNPDFMQTHLQLANVLLELGDVDAALHHGSRAMEIEPQSPIPFYVHAFGLARSGRLGEATDIVDTWHEKSKHTYVLPYLLAMGYEAIGDRDRALELFRQAIDENNAWVLWFGTEPKLDPMREDPRYKELLRSTGNPIFDLIFPGSD